MKRRRSLLLFLTVLVVLVTASALWLWHAKRQYALDRQLIAALTHNDTKQALELVNAGADINTRLNALPAPSLKQLLQQFLRHDSLPGTDSPTAFLIVCGMGWYWPKDGSLHWVRIQDDVPLVRAMLLHGADVNTITTNKWRMTVLMGAVTYRNADTVELLLEHGAKVNEPDPQRRPVLMVAASAGDEAKVAVLLAHGADVNAQDPGGYTALHAVVRSEANMSASHPLHATAKNQAYMDVMRQLLAHGANPHLTNKDGDTPLMMAQSLKLPDIVTLLKRGGK